MPMTRAKRRPKRLEVPMVESDWLALESLQRLYGERTMAGTARRAIAAELARREREETERLEAKQSRRALQEQLAGGSP